jgi:hypothetical protein
MNLLLLVVTTALSLGLVRAEHSICLGPISTDEACALSGLVMGNACGANACCMYVGDEENRFAANCDSGILVVDQCPSC